MLLKFFYLKFLPKKIKEKALGVALSLKASEGQLLVVDGLSNLKKTKEVNNLINKIAEKEGIKGTFKFIFALSDKNKEVEKVVRNIEKINVLPFRNLNAHQVYLGGILIVDKEALEEKGTTSIKSSKGTKSITRIKTARKVVERKRSTGKNARKESVKSVKKPV